MGCYLHFRLEGKLRWSPEPQQGRGRIINISSQAGFVALPTESIYCMMKAGIAQLTKCLAVEWGPHKSNVNAVAPTFIHTPGMEPALSSADFYAETLRNVAALHRLENHVRFAGAVVFWLRRRHHWLPAMLC